MPSRGLGMNPASMITTGDRTDDRPDLSVASMRHRARSTWDEEVGAVMTLASHSGRRFAATDQWENPGEDGHGTAWIAHSTISALHITDSTPEEST